MTATSTRMLASARLEFSSDYRLRVALKVAALAALVSLALAALALLGATPTSTSASKLEKQNAALRADLASARAELEIERSTRVALDAQVRELSAQAGDLRSQIEFVTAQSGRSRKDSR